MFYKLKNQRGLLALVLVMALSLLVGCRRPTLGAMESSFTLNRTKWLSQHIDSYQYAFTDGCIPCVMTPVVVEVRKGVVVSVVDKDGSSLTNWGQPYKDYYKKMGTVDDLFDAVSRYLRGARWNPTAVIEVEYDAQYGFPTKICDGTTMVAKSYGCTAVMDFEILQ